MPTKEIEISKSLEKGVKFSCKMCGGCCTGLADGEVYLYIEDIKRLAEHLNLNGRDGLKELVEKYVKIVNDSFWWKEPNAEKGKWYKFKTLGMKFVGEDAHCQFMDGKKCGVHEARPFQCRSFPFWQMMVKDFKEIKEYANKCPGLKDLNKKDAKYYSRDEIYDWAKREQEIEVDFFLKMKKNNFDIFKVYEFLPLDIEQDGD